MGIGDEEGAESVDWGMGSNPSPENVTRTLSPVEKEMGTSTYTQPHVVGRFTYIECAYIGT